MSGCSDHIYICTCRKDHNNVEGPSTTVVAGNQQPAQHDKSACSTINNSQQHVVSMSGSPAHGIGHEDSQYPILEDNPAYSTIT